MNDMQVLALMSTLIFCSGKRLGAKEAVSDARAIYDELLDANPTFVRPTGRIKLQGKSASAKVYKFLRDNKGREFTAKEISMGIGYGTKRSNIAFSLSRLCASGRLERPERGKYRFKEITSE